MVNTDIPHIASAISWWMSYISAVGRNYIIDEGSIKVPASEYLGASPVTNINLEHPHPALDQKRFDLFFIDQNGEENVIEFKYVKDGSTRSTAEKKRVFYDLMKLFLFLQANRKGYFLMCGDQADFNLSFQNYYITPPAVFITPTVRGAARGRKSYFYSRWFSFDKKNPDKVINLRTSVKDYKDIYADFVVTKSPAYLTKMGAPLIMPVNIKTRLQFLSQDMTDSNMPETTKIGIWEVWV